MRTIRPLIVLFLSAALAVAAGCVKKSFGVRTEPPGATVYLDGLELGKTPIDYVPFDFYGTREIAVYKDGYLGEKHLVKIDSPWYEYFPVDIFSDLIIPWKIVDRRQYYFELTRTVAVEDAVLMRNAETTREIARSRIDGARRETAYRPRAYVVKGEEKRSIFWGPFVSPARTEPTYLIEKPREKTEEGPESRR